MLVLVRHAPTAWNASKRIDDEVLRGRFDLPITELGRHRMVQEAMKLKRYAISEVWSSNFKRDYESGAIIAQICGARHLVNEAMAPYNIGTLAGKTIGQVWPTMQQLFRNWDLRPPSGESIKEFVARWGPIIADGRSQSRQGKAIAQIVQGTVIRFIPYFLSGEPPQTHKWDFVKPAEMIFLD
jgi:2,3-bisphosphoglycerate-dependent phosphoglycerate mutase